MNKEIIRSAARFIRESGRLSRNLTILWHAGEPLSLPISYYREAFRILSKELSSVATIKFNFQTNAITINQEWCDLFREYDVVIGVSIDGPEDIHDAYRVTKKGATTFKLTMAGIECLRKNKLPFGTISVITDKTLSRAKDMVDFFLNIGTRSIGFNIEETERDHKESTLEGHQSQVKNFVEEFCVLLDERNVLIKCREYRDIAQAVLTTDFHRDVRRGENKKFSIISVTWDGYVSTYSPELCAYQTNDYGKFIFGHVNGSFDKFSSNERLKDVSRDIEKGILKCKSDCSYFSYCGGGSPSNKLHENGTFISTSTDHCTFHKKYFVDQFIRLSEKFKKS